MVCAIGFVWLETGDGWQMSGQKLTSESKQGPSEPR
jgi:hypothetical protein